MSDARLPAGLEVAGLRRSVEANGGYVTIVHKGDPDRGSLILLVAQRGAPVAMLERTLRADGRYGWIRSDSRVADDASAVEQRMQSRVRNDPDLWLIELDVPDAERFIAEFIAVG